MKHTSKPFLVAVAAFAVTATGVYAAINTELLQRAGLSKDQIVAFEIARDLRNAGDYTHARDLLAKAGVSDEILLSLHRLAAEQAAYGKEVADTNDFLVEDYEFTLTEEAVFAIAKQTNNIALAEALYSDIGVEFPWKPRTQFS